MAKRQLLLLFVALLLTQAISASARADEASSSVVRALADRAVDDPSALDALREIDTVDGRPFDIDELLRGADEEEQASRLASLADLPDVPEDVAQAKAEADDILKGGRFAKRDPPRPLKGVADRIRSWLSPLSESIVSWTARVPGAPATLWVVFGAGFLLVVVWLSRRVPRNRQLSARSARPRVSERPQDVSTLELEADAAEAAGDLTTCVRLRFLAGLMRLNSAGVVAFDPTRTSGELSSMLRSNTFDVVVSTHERIVYGRKRPTDVDLNVLRSWWRGVIEESRAA